MRNEAYIKRKRGKKHHFKISAKAVQEEISFLKAKIEADVFAVCEKHFDEAKRKRSIANMKKTVMADDIIIANGFIIQPKRKEMDDDEWEESDDTKNTG